MLLGLSSVFAVQVAIWAGRRSAFPPRGLEVGKPLPLVELELLTTPGQTSLNDIIDDAASCHLLVLVSTSCPICRRMRVTWPSKLKAWQDSLDQPVTTVWLSEEQREALDVFISGYALETAVDIFASNAGRPTQFFEELGLIGTPTLYLLDRQGLLRYGIAGDHLPPAARVDEACGSGL